MDKMVRWSTLVSLADALRNQGSWCGETHLQKSTYLLQELAGVDLGYDFVLYKHGPFSFDFRDEISVLRARAILDRKVQEPPYGPTLLPTEIGRRTAKKFEDAVGQVRDRIDFIAARLGDKGVAELERIATAHFVSSGEDAEGKSAEERADQLVELKPHVSPDQALQAVEFVDRMREEIQDLGNAARPE